MNTTKIIVSILLGLAVLGIAIRLVSRPAVAPTEDTATTTEANLMTGMLTWGAEVRSFVPCGTYEGDAAWLVLADAGVANSLRTQYESATEERMPYTPVLATIDAEPIDPPTDGFGAEYATALYVSDIVEIFPTETCLREEIKLESPLAGATISSPLAISGVATGAWMFEGSMNAVLTNWDGEIIGEALLSAEGDWMTEELVPFSGTMEFDTPDYGERGSLIIEGSNPSGLPENDKFLEIQIQFETPDEA